MEGPPDPLRRSRVLLGSLALVWAAGCGPSSSELKREIDSLRTELTSLRAGNAAMRERLDALEMSAGGLKVGAPPPQQPGGAEDDGPPELPVVRVGPEASPAVESIGEPGTRVQIRSTPAGLVQEEVKGNEAPPPSTPAKKPAKPPAPAPAPKPKG